MSQIKQAHRIGNCPICNKEAEIIDYKKDAGCKMNPCDSNEYYSCFTDKDFPERRLVMRNKKL